MEFRGEFAVLVRNLGINLHDPTMTLVFRRPSGLGTVLVSLKRKDERTGEHSEFSRGMIAEFTMSFTGGEPGLTRFLARLEDPARQDAQLVLHSQGYRATSFRVGGFRDCLAGRWNLHARRLNRMFEQRNGRAKKKSKFLRDDFTDVGFQLREFVAIVKEGFEGPAIGPEGS